MVILGGAETKYTQFSFYFSYKNMIKVGLKMRRMASKAITKATEAVSFNIKSLLWFQSPKFIQYIYKIQFSCIA